MVIMNQGFLAIDIAEAINPWFLGVSTFPAHGELLEIAPHILHSWEEISPSEFHSSVRVPRGCSQKKSHLMLSQNQATRVSSVKKTAIASPITQFGWSCRAKNPPTRKISISNSAMTFRTSASFSFSARIIQEYLKKSKGRYVSTVYLNMIQGKKLSHFVSFGNLEFGVVALLIRGINILVFFLCLLGIRHTINGYLY